MKRLVKMQFKVCSEEEKIRKDRDLKEMLERKGERERKKTAKKAKKKHQKFMKGFSKLRR